MTIGAQGLSPLPRQHGHRPNVARRLLGVTIVLSMLLSMVATVFAPNAAAAPPRNDGGGWTTYPEPNEGTNRVGQLDNGEIPRDQSAAETLAAMEAAFSNARAIENADLCPAGVCEAGAQLMPTSISFPPDYLSWTLSERALWLINSEREARGLLRFVGVEESVEAMAQNWANGQSDQFSLLHNPIRVTQLNSLCGCAGNFETGFGDTGIAENLWRRIAIAQSTGERPGPLFGSLGVEQAIYDWMYFDLDFGGELPYNSDWGHRHALLWDNLNNDHGWVGSEGYIGIGASLVVETEVLPNGAAQRLENELIVLNMVDTRPAFPEPDEDGYASGEATAISRSADGSFNVVLPSSGLTCREDRTIALRSGLSRIFFGTETATLADDLESALAGSATGVGVGSVVTIDRPGCDRTSIDLTIADGSSRKVLPVSAQPAAAGTTQAGLALGGLALTTGLVGFVRRRAGHVSGPVS